MATFSAKLDTTAKMISALVPIVLVIPFLTIADHFGKNHEYKMFTGPVLITALFLFIILFKPKSYLVNPSVLKIVQVGFSRTIPLDEVESVEPVTRAELGFGLRTFGSGGFLGYLGKFWYKKIGHVTAYVTDAKKLLLIRLKNGRKLLISPDDTQGFLDAYQAVKG